jgi:hypothetical protein
MTMAAGKAPRLLRLQPSDDDDDDNEDAQLNVELALVYRGGTHRKAPNGGKLKLFLGAVIVKTLA